MSNLGPYQTMTTIAKKVGGPVILGLLIWGSGCLTGGSSVVIGSKVAKSIKKHNKATSKHANKIFEVTSVGETNSGLQFNIGDKYRVLESDGEAVLIEKLGDLNNPYFVSANFLSSISDFI